MRGVCFRMAVGEGLRMTERVAKPQVAQSADSISSQSYNVGLNDSSLGYRNFSSKVKSAGSVLGV